MIVENHHRVFPGDMHRSRYIFLILCGCDLRSVIFWMCVCGVWVAKLVSLC